MKIEVSLRLSIFSPVVIKKQKLNAEWKKKRGYKVSTYGCIFCHFNHTLQFFFLFLFKLQYMLDECTSVGKFNQFAPRDFAEKRVLKLVEWFSGHCCAIKS